MAISTPYPGVYVSEVAGGVRPVTGVATSITAFLGRTRRGPVDQATVLNSFADYQRIFGGMSAGSPVSFAVRDFFANGGGQAVVVRLTSRSKKNAAGCARLTRTSGTKPDDVKGGKSAGTRPPDLVLEAAEPGSWANGLTVDVLIDEGSVEVEKRFNAAPDSLFTLVVTDGDTGDQETIRNVTVDTGSTRQLDQVLAAESRLVRVPSDGMPAQRPAATTDAGSRLKVQDADVGDDGAELVTDDYVGAGLLTRHQGLWALDQVDLFNLLCVPPPTTGDPLPGVYSAALGYCVQRRAVLIVDPPRDMTVANAAQKLSELGLAGLPNARNAALYYPRLRQTDPTADGRLADFPACGAVAGVIARTDAARGVWKAPAGLEAALTGVADLAVNLTDAENGLLNPQGVNCLRSFPAAGTVVWGARTMAGADLLGDEYKYLPVRRLALNIEESLRRGTQWVVFEPNDEPLWAQIRLDVGAFLQGLFRQGAFQGTTPREAYFVKCDHETTTDSDVNLGRVNIHVGFAPVRPAEFVVLQIQQMARA